MRGWASREFGRCFADRAGEMRAAEDGPQLCRALIEMWRLGDFQNIEGQLLLERTEA
jgi:hypothetical protein